MNPEETLIDDSGNDAMGSAIAAERSATSLATVPHLSPVSSSGKLTTPDA